MGESLAVEHVVLGDLGSEHVSGVLHRRGRGEEALVAWGERIVEWPLTASPVMREVVAPQSAQVYANGACCLDVDGDGEEEVVVARGRAPAHSHAELFWFDPRAEAGRWDEHWIASLDPAEWAAPHNLQPFAFRRPDGSTGRGVVAVLARQRLVWFSIPPDPTLPWERHEIGVLPAASQSGMAVGDVAGHGRQDLVCGMFWAECPADPVCEPWTVHRFGDWDGNGWGGMAQLALGDLGADGQLAIVASEAEIPEARLGFFRRDAARPDGPWQLQLIDTGLYCPHSLVVADVDGDGRQDVIVGEMSAGGWDFPLNPRPRLLAYLNRGGGQFERLTLASGWGVHELRIAPPRADGRLTLYGADEIQTFKLPDMRTHVSYWLVGPRSQGAASADVAAGRSAG